MIEPLLRAENIKKYFPLGGRLFRKAEFVKAVDGVDLEVRKGETFGLVGESGCGKTTLGRVILRLIEPTSGRLFFEGKDLIHCAKEELRLLRKSIQVVFQDPFSSLNPRMTVGGIIGRNLKAQGIRPEGGMGPYIESLLEAVGLRPEFSDRYPHEFSGGQRQRIAIARALATRPKLIIADEPTSALDVSVQAQILNLLLDLQKKNDLTFIFISHNIRVVRHVSHRMGVMYLGKIVEIGPKRELFANPCHPYTRGLLASLLEPDPGKKMDEAPLTGEIPSSIHPPAGCRFGPRCPLKEEECAIAMPPLKEVSREHFVACHLDERTLRARS